MKFLMPTLTIFLFCLTAKTETTFNASKSHYKLANIKRDFIILDKWFFISEDTQDLVTASEKKTDLRVVKPGQNFGVSVKFVPDVKSTIIKAKIILKVPKLAENFQCPKCDSGSVKISKDHKTVTVYQLVYDKGGVFSFYWGIGKEDPTGSYEMSVYFSGTEIAKYKFEASK